VGRHVGRIGQKIAPAAWAAPSAGETWCVIVVIGSPVLDSRFGGEFRDLCRDGLCLIRLRDGPNYSMVQRSTWAPKTMLLARFVFKDNSHFNESSMFLLHSMF
jgi:hypothetical protein